MGLGSSTDYDQAVKFQIAGKTMLAIALTALSLGNGSPAPAQSLTPVNVAVGPGSLTFTPIYLADRLGYFKAEGLDIHFVTIDSAALEIAPLGVGQIDVGGGAVSAGLYNAVARGVDVKIVADLGSDPKGYGFDQLVVRKTLVASGGYKSVKDLRGKTMGITGRGISTTALVNALLKTAGLTVDDVKLVVMPVSDQLAGMANGSVDASVMPEPGPSQAEKAGVGVRFVHDDAYYPNQALVVLFFGTNFVKLHHDTGVKFMRAYLKAVRLYNDNLKGGHIAGPQAENIFTIFAEESHQDRSLLAGVTPPGNDPNGRINVASLHTDYDFFKQQGLIDAAGNPEDALDSSFVADALKTMPPYKH
jgi:NitT/TauT family transport system substrate-binding protein